MLKRKANARNFLMRKNVNMKSAGLASKIGKSGPMLSCISATTSNKIVKKRIQRNKKNKIIKTEKKYYNLPNFSSTLKSDLNNQQRSNVLYFENYPFVEKTENYSYDTNTPYTIINVYQSDFVNGTLRITKPGIYILQENIVFNPNTNDDFFPRMNQLSQYPMGSSGPYHLGFFAAITIESDDVILNLNNKTLRQGNLHNIEQRFYANIELASSPFIPSQGPGNFGSTIKFPDRVLIHNGTLGLSSHHGIHGNKMKNIVVSNVEFKDFEVAGIALNGANDSVLTDLKLLGTSTNIKVLSTYSSARFIRKFLKNIESVDASRSLNLSTGVKTIGTIINELESQMQNVKNAVIANSQIPNNVFKNTTGLYDGNVYGIALNKTGILVNDFITTLGNASTGNRHNYLNNISIKNIISEPLEIVGVNCPDPQTGAYGKGVQVGPAGDVLQISEASNNNGTFKENVLINAKLILGKFNNPKQGTTCVTSEIINWAENGSLDIRNVAQQNNRYFTSGQDSMAHAMKGNIGLFISSGENIKLKNVTIDNVKSMGNKVGVDPLLSTVNKKGAFSFGSVITGSNLINISNVNINNIFSESTNANGIMIKSSTNVSNNKLSVNNVSSSNTNAVTKLILKN